MKSFFYVVFGGLLIIAFGVTITYGGSKAWKMGAAAVQSWYKETEETTVSGIKRIIRFSAEDEEGFLEVPLEQISELKSTTVSAKAYALVNISGGPTIAEQNADVSLPVASLTKLVTAAVAKELIDPDEKITITPQIIATYGNTASFKTGETFKASDLFYPLLMVSSNDAAEALARHYGRARFMKAMNDFVQEIGAYRTYFADPSGLSEYNISSANDMVIILKYLKQNKPDILSITETKTKTIRNHTWVNPTHFLSWSNYLGGKNGYTPEANRTGAALFSVGKKDNIYAVVILGSKSRDADVVALLNKLKE